MALNRRGFLGTVALAGGGSVSLVASMARAQSARLPRKPEPRRYATLPRCSRTAGTRIQLQGPVAAYIAAVTDHWLKIAPASNPAILEMFRDRDREPLRDMVPWAGEFAGKYLTSAVQVLRARDDAELRGHVSSFVNRLIDCQDTDGYLGPWPRNSRLTGHAPNAGKSGGSTWDAWGHYHVMLGLLLWHDETGDERALNAARRIGDLICTTFDEKRLVDTGSTEMNLAPIHSLCLLYARTGIVKYLAMAQKIRDEFGAKDKDGKPLAGDYLNAALNGTEFFKTPKPRWESLHPIMGLAELYWITGDQRYRRAFEQIWWSIVKLDRHNNGGFSSGEQAQGNPYHPGAIETCCTIAWIAMGVEMLRLTGNSVVADELELSTLNAVIGLHSPSGRWVTYNTPMDGVRKASAHDIVFQAREGSSELNCCSVNGARGFGMISDWAVMTDAEGVLVNWYGPSTFDVPLPGGVVTTIRQDTTYPADGRVHMSVSPSKTAAFALKLRIPYWSRTTRLAVNGKPVSDLRPGQYAILQRKWRRGDTVELELDLSLHVWAGERECEGKASIFRGPILLTYDRRFNDMSPDHVPAIPFGQRPTLFECHDPVFSPIIMTEFTSDEGKRVRLCDFGSAGFGGSPYRSWLPVTGALKAEFSGDNPLRSRRRSSL